MNKVAKWLCVMVIALNAVSVNHCGLQDEDDPRLGENGRVRFNGGGGCNGSTTLAVGSTARLDLEPAEGGRLPEGLSPSSTAPAVIAAAPGEKPDQVVLTAGREGEAFVELMLDAGVYDRLGFSVEPARSASFQASAEVFAGGGIIVKIDEVYGACGEDCPLIGGDFIEWSVEPQGALTLDTSDDRVALLIAGDPGEARIVGREPSAGRVIVDHTVAVLPVDAAGELRSRVTIQLPDETVLDPAPLPSALPTGSLVLLELTATDADGDSVPLTGRNVIWTVEGHTGVFEPWAETADDPPVEGPIYQARIPGTVTLVAWVPLLGKTARFDLEVTLASGE